MAGTIFDNRMGSCVASRAPSVDVGTLHANISSVKDLPPNVRATVQDCFTGALSDIWLALIAFSCSIFIAMAAVVFVKRRMNQAQKERKAVAQENEKDYSGSSSPAESEEGAESGEGQQIA